MTIEIPKGETIYRVVPMAVETARANGVEVSFTFNDIELCVSPFSHHHDILTIYGLKRELLRYTS